MQILSASVVRSMRNCGLQICTYLYPGSNITPNCTILKIPVKFWETQKSVLKIIKYQIHNFISSKMFTFSVFCHLVKEEFQIKGKLVLTQTVTMPMMMNSDPYLWPQLHRPHKQPALYLPVCSRQFNSSYCHSSCEPTNVSYTFYKFEAHLSLHC